MNAWGVKSCRAHEKRVPESIFTAKKSTVTNFLRGLFCADGTVYTKDKNHRTVRLTSTSKELLQDTQLLLLNYGIHGKIYSREKRNQMNFRYVTKEGEEKGL